MLNLSRWKVILVVAAVIFGILFALPNMLPARMLAQLPGWMPKKTLNLGLDLQGGSYLLLEVDTTDLRKEKLTALVEDTRQTLRTNQIEFTDLGVVNGDVMVRIVDPAKVDAAYRNLNNLAGTTRNGAPDMTVSRTGDQRLRLAYAPEAMSEQAASAVEQSIEIIRRRIDPEGNKEIPVTRQGEDRIVVQAPGEDDPERLKNLIGQTAKLTFHMVDHTVTAQDIAAGRIPPGSKVLPSTDGYSPAYVIRTRPLLTGEMLTNAWQGNSPETGQPIVNFRFNGQGARRFAQATAPENVGKQFAIVLDEVIISAPAIDEPIIGGSGYIRGSFTTESANDLATLLKAGALPAKLTVEEQRTVGAELGADAVKAGATSTIVGFIGILVFMVLAYGFLFGGISVIALLINGLLIVAVMSLSGATLTLPGIAGLILTLAVAVDANVLIYERMRDEIRGGRTVIASMEAGFSRAMTTIIDANVTTLAAAVIMFWFGSGPVRGFAWTLSIGVFTSVFTAVLVTQVLLALWFRARRPKTLPIA